MDDLPLDEKVVALTSALTEAGIPHAFGGALALAYYAEPRATIDIDLNVFLRPEEARALLDVLVELGVHPDRPRLRRELRRDGQARVWWGPSPLDLFLAYDRFHFACATRVKTVPFGQDRIPILAPQDLVVRKAVFGRRKDWLDIEQVLLTTAGDLELDEIRAWIHRIVGPGDHRVKEFERTVGAILGEE